MIKTFIVLVSTDETCFGNGIKVDPEWNNKLDLQINKFLFENKIVKRDFLIPTFCRSKQQYGSDEKNTVTTTFFILILDYEVQS